MVKRVTLDTAPRPSDGRAGLGPRGRAIFERLFGDRRSTLDGVNLVRPRAPVIAIGSGKGGTGKSFLCTSLAVVLHRRGHRVTLVDCDFGLACDHLLLGIQPAVHLQHLLQGRAELAAVCHRTPAGPSLVPGVTGVRQMASLPEHELRTFGRVLADVARDADVVLLDTGAGLSAQNVLSLCLADHVVLVTQPEIAALTDAYAVVKTLAQLNADVPLSVAVNRVHEGPQGVATFDKLHEVAERHTGVRLASLGCIPEDPLVTQRRLGQLPLVATDPDCETALAVRAVADRLTELAGPFGPRAFSAQQQLEVRLEEFRPIV